MKTIQKILWGFISTVICLLYRTDVNAYSAPTYYKEYNNGIVRFRINTNNATCKPTTNYNCNTPLNEYQAIGSAIQQGAILPNNKCGRNQYVTGCDCADGTFKCCTVDNIQCATCPNGGYTMSSAAIYVTATQQLGSQCCHWDGGTTSYNMFFALDDDQIIIVNPSISNCFMPKAETYHDASGQYEFINSCYYNS